MKNFNNLTELEKSLQTELLEDTFTFEDNEEMKLTITTDTTLIYLNEDKDLQIVIDTINNTVKAYEEL